MQKAAAFFGGAVLGGVISAACGFDLFREERSLAQRDALQRSQEELQRTKGLLAKAREALARSGESSHEGPPAAATVVAAASRPDGAGANEDRVRVLEEQLGKTRADAERQRNDAARLSNEAAAARHAFTSASLEARKWKEQLHEQMLRFFSKERGAADAELVSDYLSSPGSKDEKQALILELIKKNKDVLLSLPHETSAAPTAPTAASQESGSSVVGASAREAAEPSRPEAPIDTTDAPARKTP